ncbi:MAG TPA: response regulator [Bauldia sp.]|nr:response regulator [Bauldia sp.]
MADDKTKLDLLLVEDTEDDAQLLLRQLKQGGYDVTYDRVESAAGVQTAIDRKPWDLVISDYNMPGFTGVDALKIVRERDSDTPFIFVSGTMGEETAVAALHAGAQDYLIKGKTARLASVIERELREARLRRERRLADAKLRQLSRAVEQAANFVIITDSMGRIEYVNPGFEKAAGYTNAELAGRPPFFWKLAPAQSEELWATARSGLDWRGEFDNVRRDGTALPVSVIVSPVTDETGAITHIIAIEEDISRRREVEAQLRQSQKMEAVGNLTGGMAHDFNNLLAVIIGNLDLLVGRRKEDTEIQDLAAEALEAAVHGADLTKRLLAFARRQPLQPQELDLNELVDSTAKLLKRLLGQRVEIDLGLSSDAWPVVADPSQLAAAVTNLATNARDAMPNGGRLTIRTRNSVLDTDYALTHPGVKIGEYAEIAVTDTGTGMPPDVVARIFEPFFTTKEMGKGTGLGLSMVYGFITQSGGHVAVDSVPGEGTTFHLFLPRVESAVATKTGDDTQQKDLSGKGQSVLVVEDVALLRRVVVKQLTELGYRVIEAETIGAALAVLEHQPIDILFTDVVVGEGPTGFDLARVVANRWPMVRTLFTSGFPQSKLNTGSGPPPGARILNKPYRKEELARAIAEA